MPNTKSAEKRVRQNERRRIINRRNLSQLRTAIKKFRRLLEEKNAAAALKALPEVYGVIDRSSQKRVIHANTAARYKSRLAKHLNALKGAHQPTL